MCAYTRLVMGWIPEDHVATVSSGSRTVSLAPLGVDKLPEPKGKVHLVAKVPLAPAKDQDGDPRERYYLIEARRFWETMISASIRASTTGIALIFPIG